MNHASVNWIGFYTILRKEVVRILRIWGQTLVPPAITMSLYFVIFGNLIGRRIGTMHGIEYMQYIVPGLVMMSVITNAYGNVSSSLFGAKFGRHIEELLISPLPNWIILAGYVSAAVFRGLVVGVLVLGVARLFTPLTLVHPWITLSTFLLTTVAFSLAGLINAIYARKFDDIAIVPTFVLAPLTYLGGVFYSIDLLPGIWRDISAFNPILYMVSAFRYGMLGISDVPIPFAYALLAAFVTALTALALYLLHKGIGLRT